MKKEVVKGNDNAIEFVKVAKVEITGENVKEKLKIFEKNEDNILDKYHMLKINVDETSPKIYRLEFPIFETRKEIEKYLGEFIKDLKGKGLEVRLCEDIETKKIPRKDYPIEREKRLIEKYGNEHFNGDLFELEYGIKIIV